MSIRVIVSDTSNGDHAQAVKAAISSGYGSDISDQIGIVTGGIMVALEYAKNNGAIAVVRSTSGISSYQTSALDYYPDILAFMPLGSNLFVELISTPGVIVSCGAGDNENKNNTGYGTGLEFWDNDLETTVTSDFSSFANGVIAGKILKIKDTLNCSWWEARYRARMTCDKGEDNRTGADWDLFNGYGKINVNNAIAYSGVIIADPFIDQEQGGGEPNIQNPVEEENETQNNIVMQKEIFIDLAKVSGENAIELFRGDSGELKVYVTRNGVIQDLTGYSAIMSVKAKPSNTDYSFLIYGSDVSLASAASGIIAFTIDSDKTEDLTTGMYYYDIQIKNESVKYTIVSDKLLLKADITREDLEFNLATDDYDIQLTTEDGKFLLTENSI